MKYQLTKHTSLTNIDADAVLLDIDTGQYYGLNHVGAKFLNLIQQGHNTNSAITELAETYSTSHPLIEKDIHELITQLLEKNLLEIIEQ